MSNPNKPDATPRLLIAGFGDLGQRLVPLVPRDWAVHALKRGPTATSYRALNIIQADLTRAQSLAVVDTHWDAVVYTATPDKRTPEAYRASYVDGLRNLLDRIDTKRLLMVSSTAVYGQDQGEWVDEQSPTDPSSFTGDMLLEAEHLAQRRGGIVVRFSGIYGPGRTRLIDHVQQGGVRCQRHPPIWTNRIHADDCARGLAHLLLLESPESLYLASDDEPSPRWDVYHWLAEQMHVRGPIEAHGQVNQLGKRVRNTRLSNSGFRLRYRHFRAGYSELLMDYP
ncbi:MAG: NAD-dependent epimerase/dehydratase family protein [Pseudomonadota bacterium]